MRNNSNSNRMKSSKVVQNNPQFKLPSLRQYSGMSNKNRVPTYKRDKPIIIKNPNNGSSNYNPYMIKYHKPYSGNPSLHQKTIKKNEFIFRPQKREIATPNPTNVAMNLNNFNNNYNYNHNHNHNHININNNRLFYNLPLGGSLNANYIIANNNNNSKKIHFSKSLPRNAIASRENSGKRQIEIAKPKKNTIYKEFYYLEEKNLEHRKTMEDFHTVIESFANDNTKSFFAIYDGHSGDFPAKYCRDNLHIILNKCLHKTNFNVSKSLTMSFIQADNEINNNAPPPKKSKSDTDPDGDDNGTPVRESGTTATVAFLFKEYNSQLQKNQSVLYCANVGDSKGYIVTKEGKVMKITKDHKCEDANEVARVKQAGGIVFGGRVFGTLMLTRSIGDKEMKKYGVVANPSIFKKVIDDNDEFLILASDGLWDVVSEDELKKFSGSTAENMCKKLIKFAITNDTRDNVSCIVVKL